MNSTNWTVVAESRFQWERDALDFIRQNFPKHEPYRAWSNFEFIADDGSINEVDLLIFTPHGFFIIEIKSWPGRLFGDSGTWTVENEGKLATFDNPLFSANLKAKKLRWLLQRQKAFHRRGQPPFIEALIFCSAPGLRCELQGNARFRVCLRDRKGTGGGKDEPGIIAAVMRRDCPGLEQEAKGIHDRPMATLIGQAMEQAGIRPSQRHRKVSDFVLQELIGQGPGVQDWRATHTRLPDSIRRVRLYLVRTGATAGERKTIDDAALREYKLLESLQHPGILRVHGFTEHEVGSALIFEHDPSSVRLDHYLAEHRNSIGIDVQLQLIRQIGEVIRYAHEKRIVHRALSPQSILVIDGDTDHPRIKVFNWQSGYRSATSTSHTGPVTATSHIDRLVEDAATAYMAPEVFVAGDDKGEHLDIFSLGAIAYHIFAGVPPAANGLELSNKLRDTKGLQISAVLNGAIEELQDLIQYSTHPEVLNRISSATEFLEYLDIVEDKLTSPEDKFVDDPNRAQIGDILAGGFRILKHLGQGACSVALLVERDGQEFVLKVANDPEHNARLKGEAEVLSNLRHEHIVEWSDTVEIGNRTGFLMKPVFADKAEKRIETLGQRLRKEGRLHIDLLQRFGDDLLDAVGHLEELGYPHRDIKPDNIAIGMLGRGDRLHAFLFDFSLSRTASDNLHAGTPGYVDPVLPLRKHWDLYAERYSAAATLYELATGTLPKWGDGWSNPVHLNCEISIDGELFDPNLRERFVAFFARAFRRNASERFDNAEEMLRAWRHCFEGIEQPGALSEHGDESRFLEIASTADLETPIAALGLGARATNALDRANILTVGDLLSSPIQQLVQLRGVGNKTRREISTAVEVLRKRLGSPPLDHKFYETERERTGSVDPRQLSVDLLLATIVGGRAGRDSDTTDRCLRAFLGLDNSDSERWPSQSDLARWLNVTRARIGQIVSKFQTGWARNQAVTFLRSDIADMINAQGGVMTLDELAAAVLVARGSAQAEPERTRSALAVIRAAVEAERVAIEPRYVVRRDRNFVLIGKNIDLTVYAIRLGAHADNIADEDPLLAPGRVIEKLREVKAPAGADISDNRLVRLAVAASEWAALSSRQELYPRGMPVVRALKLSQGALLGIPQLTPAQIRDRVHSRYPDAAPLPERPALDNMLHDAGLELEWDPAGRNGLGCYVNRLQQSLSISTGSRSPGRLPTTSGPLEPVSTPETADARQFEERLQRALKDGAFLALLVEEKNYQRAADELSRRFPLRVMDLEGAFIDTLREVSTRAKVDWDLVLRTDANPGAADWDKFMLLVQRAMPVIEEKLSAAKQTTLVVYPGLLARYERMDLLERMREKIGRRDGIPGLWVLVAGDDHPLIDGKPVPIVSPGQRARIPESWLQNLHRANGREG